MTHEQNTPRFGPITDHVPISSESVLEECIGCTNPDEDLSGIIIARLNAVVDSIGLSDEVEEEKQQADEFFSSP